MTLFDPIPLPREFFARPTRMVAPELLGKILLYRPNRRQVLAARIVEVEAYLGQRDPASHAYRGPRGRAAIMFGLPGKLYVYFTYGMHYCMNVVAHDGTQAGAILLRAAEPLQGVAIMRANRGRVKHAHALARGPACLAAAFGINTTHNGLDLVTGPLTLHAPSTTAALHIATSTRIGISKAIEKPWRYYLCGSLAVSGPPRLRRCTKHPLLSRGVKSRLQRRKTSGTLVPC